MEEYISKETFHKLSSELHLELLKNKFDKDKEEELNKKLIALKRLRSKSEYLEHSNSVQKGYNK